MARLTSGAAPVLAAHEGGDLTAVIGVVERARLEAGQGIATVRFAKDDPGADAAWNKVEQGILEKYLHRLQGPQVRETGRAATTRSP